MTKMKLENIEFNGKEYTLIEVFTELKDIGEIYYLLGMMITFFA